MWRFYKILLIGILCLSTLSGFADDSEKLRIFPQGQPATFLGLDDTSSPVFVKDGRARDLLNVKFTSTGGLKKRYGYSLINESLDDFDLSFPAITGIYDVHYSTGNNYIVGIVGTKIKYKTTTDWLSITSQSNTITTGQDNQFTFTVANDNLIGTNDVDIPFQLSSSLGASNVNFSGLSSALTKAKCVAWFRNHLIFANTYEGTTEYPTRIRWSNIGKINTWTDDDYIDIASLSGEEINAMAELYGDVYIFLDKSIWKISFVGGDEVYVLSKIANGIGCIAKNSIQTITLPNNRMAIIFLDKNRKVYLFDGTAPVDISANIETLMSGVSDSRLKYAVSTQDGDSYYLCITESGYTTNNRLLEFDYTLGEWTKHDNINANYMAQVEESTNIMKTYFGDYTSMIYWMDDTNLSSDVDGLIGTISSVITDPSYVWNTATGLQVIFPTTTGLTVSGLIGGIINITSGTGVGQEKVIADNTATGIVVTSSFTTTPDSTSSFSIGVIDAYFTTKWYDLGDPTRNKLFRQLYLWGEEKTNTTHNVSYYDDFGGLTDTISVSMSGGSASLWGTAVWGTSTWGAVDSLFKQEKLSGEGRYISLKFRENDIDEDMNIYGYNILYDALDNE